MKTEEEIRGKIEELANWAKVYTDMMATTRKGSGKYSVVVGRVEYAISLLKWALGEADEE